MNVPTDPTAAELPPTTRPTRDDVRRANRRLLAGLVVFALALCATVFLWMYGRMVHQQELMDAADRATQTNAAAPANPSPSPVAPR